MYTELLSSTNKDFSGKWDLKIRNAFQRMFINLKRKMSERKIESIGKNNFGKGKYLSKYKNYLHIILDSLKDSWLFKEK